MTTTSLQFALDRGERQLWAGRPRQGFLLRPSDAFQIPFSLLWAGFIVFWESSAVRTGAPLFFMLWGVPFMAMGAYITVGRFWVDARRRARTSYAVTSKRVIINSGAFTPTSKSLVLDMLRDVSVDERPDGTGTILFGPMPVGRRAGLASWTGEPPVPSFEAIPDARRVYAIVAEAQRAALREATAG